MKKFFMAWVICVMADLGVIFCTSKLITDGVITNGFFVGLFVIFACPAVESVLLLATRQFESKAMFKNMYMAQLIAVGVAALIFWRFSSALELSITDLSALFFGFVLFAPPVKFFLINFIFPFFDKSECEGSGFSVKQ
jgi:hypothetical protein